MSKFFIKMIGTIDHPLSGPYTLPYADFTLWPRKIRPGDHMVLYAVGAGRRIFALVKVESKVRRSGVEKFPYRVDISYLVNLPPSSGIHLDEITVDRNLLGPIQRGSTYFTLRPEEYALAASKLRAATPMSEQETYEEELAAHNEMGRLATKLGFVVPMETGPPPAEQVRGIAAGDGPPPDDNTVKRWIQDGRVEKYG